jgi:hypothetical protein
MISNAQFSVRLQKSDKYVVKKQVCCSELADNFRTKLADTVKGEHGIELDPTVMEMVFLRTSELSMEDPVPFIQGKLMHLLMKIQPDRTLSTLPALYQALMGEIQQKNRYLGDVSSFEDLLAQKAVTRSKFQNLLEIVLAEETRSERWKSNIARMEQELTPYPMMRQIRAQYRVFTAQLTDSSNLALQSTIAEVQAISEEVLANTSHDRISDALEEIVARYLDRQPSSPYDGAYVRALALAECL